MRFLRALVPAFREAAPILLICAGGLAAKIALMQTSQCALDGDEAIIGLMARHVQQGLSHPLFFYGQSYDAGAGVLAHAAGLVQSDGVSVLSLKILALLLWLGMTAMAAHVVGSWAGWRAAAWTAANASRNASRARVSSDSAALGVHCKRAAMSSTLTSSRYFHSSARL